MTLEEFNKEEVEKAAKIAGEIARYMGIMAAEAEEAIGRVMRHLPPIGEPEIEQIKRNPSLTRFQKRRLIREIKKGANNER
jgi:hypothetical protein